MNFETFIFESFEWQDNTLHLRYSFDETEYFEETWEFPSSQVPKFLSSQAVQEASKGLWLMCGISYYKAALPSELRIKNCELRKEQADFFHKAYLHGLGEFFYTNQIDPFIPEFPSAQVPEFSSSQVENLSGTLISIGGGKDSLVTVELLKQAGLTNLTTWNMGQYEFFGRMVEKIGLPHLTVKRTICPNLIRLNKEGAFNGHVPISAIWAFASTIQALREGKQYIAFSNEASANEGNTRMGDLEINHQYSKSLEFEKDFQSYVRNFITPSVHYFSFLRPLTEIHIVHIFYSKLFEKYKDTFSSCNRNFHITKDKANTSGSFRWCGECPKCAFLSCLLAPFIDKKELIHLFGKNPFEDDEILAHFPALLGLQDIKPFECVGEAIEVQTAINMAYETGQYPELERWVKPVSD